MAEANLELHPEDGEREEQRLKYLDFVHTAAIHAVIGLSKIYGFAKDKAGPLRPSVETVEGTVKTVVRPVCDKFHGVPTEVLKFVDRKIDASVAELDRRVPQTLKQVSTQAISAAQKSPEVARAIAAEVRKSGVVDKATGLAKSVYTKCEPTAKGLYSKYEPKAEECAASTWRKMNQLPLFPRVAQVVLPTARYCTEKYNDAVQLTAEKGYRVSPYLPLVPTEKISKVFSNGGPDSEPLVSNADLAVH